MEIFLSHYKSFCLECQVDCGSSTPTQSKVAEQKGIIVLAPPYVIVGRGQCVRGRGCGFCVLICRLRTATDQFPEQSMEDMRGRNASGPYSS